MKIDDFRNEGEEVQKIKLRIYLFREIDRIMTISCRWYQPNGRVLKNWGEIILHPNMYNASVL